jgi:hypothetical protein
LIVTTVERSMFEEARRDGAASVNSDWEIQLV